MAVAAEAASLGALDVMQAQATWTESNFAEMSWHDNYVHGFRIREGEHGTGEVEFDIDYILEWLPPSDGTFTFRVAPANLTFRKVYDLQIEVDYATVSAGLQPFCISEIQQEACTDGGPPLWKILLNWPEGQICFRAEGFDQRLRTEPVTTKTQGFTHDERIILGA